MFPGFMMDDSGFIDMETLFYADYLLPCPDNINSLVSTHLNYQKGRNQKVIPGQFLYK
jgi:hypothetical protein